MMNWSRKKVALLIELYRVHPELWNPKHSNYRDQMKRNRSWREISEIVQADRMEVFKKIKNLCSQFHRERKKLERNRKMNQNADENDLYESRWFAFKSMSFLKYKNQPMDKEQQENVSSEVNRTVLSLSNDQDKCEDNGSDDNSEDQEQYVVSKLTQPSLTRKIIKPPELKRKQDTNPSCSYSSTNKMLKTSHDNRPIRDEFSIFGEIVAYKIRNLPTKYARSTVQHLFNNILYEADLGKYDHPPGNSTNGSRKRVDTDCSNITNPVFVEDSGSGILFEEENVDSPSSTASNTLTDSDYLTQVKEEQN